MARGRRGPLSAGARGCCSFRTAWGHVPPASGHGRPFAGRGFKVRDPLVAVGRVPRPGLGPRRRAPSPVAEGALELAGPDSLPVLFPAAPRPAASLPGRPG